MSFPLVRFVMFAALGSVTSLWSQRPPNHGRYTVPQLRIDLRDLGYQPVDVIPADDSAIRALAVAPDGRIYGATSGGRSHLFVLDPRDGFVQPLGFLPTPVVHHALVVSSGGDVYIGGALAVDNDGKGYEDYEGGHLFKYSPALDSAESIRIDSPCPVTDLGVPARGQGVYALAIDRNRGAIYGLTYPHGDFFSYAIPSRSLKLHGRVAEKLMPGESFEWEKNIGRSLAIDRDGNVFTTGEGGRIFCFRVEAQALVPLEAFAPAVPGREVYNRVDAWAWDPAGMLYGGTADGYLFRFDPKTLRVECLGKPLAEYRTRGLVFARDGKLYGIGGGDDEMARLFSYQPDRGSYEILGLIDVHRRPYYAWQGYVFDSMAVGLDGTIYLGQCERRSKLYIFYP